MFKGILEKFFGDRKTRLMKTLRPDIEAVKEWSIRYRELSKEEIPKKTEEFIKRLSEGETTDDIMHEAFGLVHETCRRNVGNKWGVAGHEIEWDMIPYDVQIAGAICLHRGSIVEMATGEGKTLVATMPLYLNALDRKGASLVTVNDYLAKRDADWMSGIYQYLGVTVGCLQNEMMTDERRDAYSCDITYGTNNEFGFDYLRDNMKLELEEQVQREHHYAIIDEVDSVLIDEARTPLIISGPVPGSSIRDDFELLRSRVENLVKKQKRMVNDILKDLSLSDTENEGKDEYEIGKILLLANRGDPKNKRFMKLRKKTGYERMMLSVEADYMREKKLHMLDEELFIVIDEKAGTVDLTEKGRETLSSSDRELFVLPDLGQKLHEIDMDESLSKKEKIRKKDKAYREYASKSEKIHNFNQLLKAYTLFEKDVEYVVQDGKVLIVDEFTGRLMPGRRFSDGLHQALEAKERVKVEGETQTFATITLQNYFRMYDKLAGMTGTAETEEEEFHKIYDLDVEVIPTNRPVRRIDYDDKIYKTKREKINAIINEIKRLNTKGLPILVGTISVDFSETLSRMLKREGISHNVLNAKHHKKEAEIVAYAGKKGAVTIATNMAGRGTDIKLEEGVVKCNNCCIDSENPGECEDSNDVKVGACIQDMPCGLHIIGTERHESRRIDRQLRGRSGRQGDPGASKFFISLEDDLMRLFGSDRVSAIMDKLGLEEGESIQHSFITKAISKSQKRVEMYNFGIRKRLLEYDDVMNKQREVIYDQRNEILRSEKLDQLVSVFIEEYIDSVIEKYLPENAYKEDWDIEAAALELEQIFIVPFEVPEENEDEFVDPVSLRDAFVKKANEAYEIRKSTISPEIMSKLEKMVMLQSIDAKWMEHLRELDNLKEGIHLRSYAQKDPVIEYKQEAFALFTDVLEDINRSVLWGLFHARLEKDRKEKEKAQTVHEVTDAYSSSGVKDDELTRTRQMSADEAGKSGRKTIRRKRRKIGRNEPCPCGSGKKYKNCCGRK
ncbi:MAG TPA: preprotein translocase subunit SecA [Candidatus Krumholzibacteriaceae bacterium]|nr:preprotein translocase subunit SecA [Candidatus Krumholzibacteriaceae bacterium]